MLQEIENTQFIVNLVYINVVDIFLTYDSKYIKSIIIALKIAQIVNYSIASLAQNENKNN